MSTRDVFWSTKHYAVIAKKHVYHNVNKIQITQTFTLIFDLIDIVIYVFLRYNQYIFNLIDNGVYVVYALYSSTGPKKNKFSNVAGYTPLKYVFSGKPLIAPEPEVGKFQNWAEMKVNYPTNKENTPEDFSDNFRNIKFSSKLTISKNSSC